MHNRFSNQQIAGAMIALSSVMSIILMAHHPTTGAHEIAGQVAEIANEARINRFVHGGLIGLLFLNLSAFTIYAMTRGVNNLAVLIALFAYIIGTLLMTGAALVNGFIYPEFLQQTARYHPDLLQYTPLFRSFSWNINQVLADTSVVAISAAMILWSINLFQSHAVQKLIALVGIVVGVVITSLMLSGWLRLDLMGMTAVVVSQTIWNLGIAYLLILKKIN